MSLYTELFIRSELSRQSGLSKQDILFEYSERGKPFFAQNKDIHFSVSHSGNCIVFAGHTLPVGIDVEKIKEMREKVAKRYFTEREQKYIFDSQDKDIAFYYIWTRKEAYLKKTGDGLSKKLVSFFNKATASSREHSPSRYERISLYPSPCIDTISL